MPSVTCPTCGTAVEMTDGPKTCPACEHLLTPAAEASPPVPAAADAAEAEAFPVLPFVATPAGRPGGLGVAAAFGLAAAVAIGVVAGLIRGYFWLVLVFPLAHGAAVGGLTGLGGRVGRARMPRAVGVVGGVCAALSAAGLYYLDYLGHVPAPLRQLIGFWDYLDLRATEGVTIGKPGAKDKGMNLGYVGSIIYWVVEVGAAAAGGAGIASAVVSAPFCTDCRVWKRKRTLGPYRADPQQAAGAVAAGVPAAAVVPAGDLPKGEKKEVAVAVYTCDRCGDAGTADVEVDGRHVRGKEATTYKVFMTYPGAAAGAFDEADRQARAAGLAGK